MESNKKTRLITNSAVPKGDIHVCDGFMNVHPSPNGVQFTFLHDRAKNGVITLQVGQICPIKCINPSPANGNIVAFNSVYTSALVPGELG